VLPWVAAIGLPVNSSIGVDQLLTRALCCAWYTAFHVARSGVRSEASATLGELVTAVGKAVAPHIKQIMGPWWLAQFDPAADVAAAARAAFQVREDVGSAACVECELATGLR
jgi:hypothetical protein